MMKVSKALLVTMWKKIARKQFAGGFVTFSGWAMAFIFIVSTHWACSGVIVAEPPDSAIASFLMAVNCSTTTPTKRLMAKKLPMNIHRTAKMAAAPESFRIGARPGSVASISPNMIASQPSPVIMTNRSIIDEPKESKEPITGLAQCT